VICCSFVYKPGDYDDDFHRLDGQIDHFARSLPGFRTHLEAKSQVGRWYDGYRIVVSEVTATYGNDKLPV
jgi:hypothetical protein